MYMTTLPSPFTCTVIWIRYSKQDLENFREHILKGVLFKKVLFHVLKRLFNFFLVLYHYILSNIKYYLPSYQISFLLFLSALFDTDTIKLFWTLYITTEIKWAKMNCTLSHPIFASSYALRRACGDLSSKVQPESANLCLDKRTQQIKHCSSQKCLQFLQQQT